MSRSRKRPFQSICGPCSAKQDKRIAARGVRRVQNYHLQKDWQSEEFILPHRYECPHNDVWGWCRDGKQRYQVPTAREWSRHYEAVFGLTTNGWMLRYYGEWPPPEYARITRK